MQSDFQKPAAWLLALGCALICALTGAPALARAPVINNTNVAEAPVWVEDTAALTPPTYSIDQLLPLDLPLNLTVKAGIDPASISVGADKVIRYVVVIDNQSGSLMASFEGLRCETREVKVYARQNSAGDWKPVTQPVWREVNGNMPSHHAQIFARQAACTDAAGGTPEGIAAALKSGAKPNMWSIRQN